jgi:hypothetical protein
MTASVRTTRRQYSLWNACCEFWKHPSPYMIGATLVAAVTARAFVGGWQIGDAIVPLVMMAVFPFFEWVVHVFILHWRPKQFGGFTVDPLLARKHREHHVDPRDIPPIFIPTKSLLWLIPLAVTIALLAFGTLGLGLTFLCFLLVLGLGYEWCHFLIHSDYKPKTEVYRAVWRNHRQHHYKNEHYWFTVTSSGTADRLLGTYPDPAAVTTSPTAKNLHASV